MGLKSNNSKNYSIIIFIEPTKSLLIYNINSLKKKTIQLFFLPIYCSQTDIEKKLKERLEV